MQQSSRSNMAGGRQQGNVRTDLPALVLRGHFYGGVYAGLMRDRGPAGAKRPIQGQQGHKGRHACPKNSLKPHSVQTCAVCLPQPDYLVLDQ
jgi:hypothetical protein